MVHAKGLTLRFWMEGINCANYIVNHTPTKALKDITPKGMWSNIKPYVIQFHVFGSEVWTHTPYEKQKSLQHKSEVHIFWIL